MKKTGTYQNRSSTTKNIKNEPKGGRENTGYNHSNTRWVGEPQTGE